MLGYEYFKLALFIINILLIELAIGLVFILVIILTIIIDKIVKIKNESRWYLKKDSMKYKD